MTLGEGVKVGQTGGRPLLREDGTEDRPRVKPGQATEIGCCLRLPCPSEHPAFLGPKGKDVARPDEIIGTGLRINQCLDCGSPIIGGDAGRGSHPSIHRDTIGGVT